MITKEEMEKTDGFGLIFAIIGMIISLLFLKIETKIGLALAFTGMVWTFVNQDPDDHKTLSSWLEEVIAMICFAISLGQFISALQGVAEA